MTESVTDSMTALAPTVDAVTESVTDSMTALAPAVGVATESVTESEVVHFPVTEFRDGLGDSARGRDIVATDSVTAS